MRIKFKIKRKRNLYCCGNCKYRASLDSHDHVIEKCRKGNITKSFEYCSQYEFDDIDILIRTIDYSKK